MYESGMHLGTSNLLHLALSTFDPAGFGRMQIAFVGMCRNRTNECVDAFYDAVDAFDLKVTRATQRQDPVVASIRASRVVAGQSFMAPQATGTAPNELDPAVSCLIALIHDWTEAVGSITVEHDNSKEINRSLEQVKRLWESASTPLKLSFWNDEQLAYPLSVDDFDLVASTESARVQVADLVAGAAAVAHGDAIGHQGGTFGERLRELPWDGWRSNASVWPSTTDITPNRTRTRPPTPWPADAMADWLK